MDRNHKPPFWSVIVRALGVSLVLVGLGLELFSWDGAAVAVGLVLYVSTQGWIEARAVVCRHECTHGHQHVP